MDLCEFCHNRLPNNHSACFRCAVPLASTAFSEDRQICGSCLSTPTGVDHSIIPFLYRPPIDYMIKRLKFSEQMAYSRLLGELLANAVQSHYAADDQKSSINEVNDFPSMIIPVPTHHTRLHVRGFNQAQVIANTVARRFNRKSNTQLVHKSATMSQSKLSAAQREINMRRTFSVQDPASVVKDAHVAIVDDVCTTGATTRAITRKLKSAGAAKVSVWAVARTP